MYTYIIRDVVDAKECAEEMMSFLVSEEARLGYQRIGNMLSWLQDNDSLEGGTALLAIQVWYRRELIAYGLFESYENRSDKVYEVDGKSYRELGLVHFRTGMDYRGHGVASAVANKLYRDVIGPMLSRYPDGYVTAVKGAIGLMERTGIDRNRLATELHSGETFKEKVLSRWTTMM